MFSRKGAAFAKLIAQEQRKVNDEAARKLHGTLERVMRNAEKIGPAGGGFNRKMAAH